MVAPGCGTFLAKVISKTSSKLLVRKYRTIHYAPAVCFETTEFLQVSMEWLLSKILPDLAEPEVYMASYRSQKEPKNEISRGSKRFQAGNAILLLWP